MSQEHDEYVADALSCWVDLLNAGGKEVPIAEYVERFRIDSRGEIGTLCRAAMIIQELIPMAQACVCRRLDVLRMPIRAEERRGD